MIPSFIGFAHLLEDPATGPLGDKQREYVGYINASSASLLAIINDILDLATIDAGVMTLDLGPAPRIEYHSRHDEEDWTVTLLDTGQNTQTAGRLKRALPFSELRIRARQRGALHRSRSRGLSSETV